MNQCPALNSPIEVEAYPCRKFRLEACLCREDYLFELYVLNHILKHLSVPKGLGHKVARDFLAKIKIEIKAPEARRKASTLIAMI